MLEKSYRVTVEPRILSEDEIRGISDAHERQFGLAAIKAGLEVREGGMITLNGVNINKKDKASTNPDFLVDGVFVEITRGNNLGSRKARQKQVMEKAGLPYVQLTGSQIEALSEKKDLRSAITDLLKGSF